jgi:toxin ParE1/3/4
MRIIWAEQARREWAEHYRFYATRNPDAARRMRQLLRAGVSRLRDYPQIGRPGKADGTRELVISGTPFLLVYEENPVRVEILHVYDGRQNWQEAAE